MYCKTRVARVARTKISKVPLRTFDIDNVSAMTLHPEIRVRAIASPNLELADGVANCRHVTPPMKEMLGLAKTVAWCFQIALAKRQRKRQFAEFENTTRSSTLWLNARTTSEVC